MLITKRPVVKVTPKQTVSLDEAGGAVMLSLSDSEGHVFRQALDAHDAGVLLELLDLGGVMDERNLCQGDLVAKKIVVDNHEELHLVWHDERGGDGLVSLGVSDEMIFEEALRSYCKMLMRSKG